MLVVEEHNRAAGLDVEGAGSVQDSVFDDVHDAVFRDGGFGFDLYDGATHDGGVKERLGSPFGHDGGWRERYLRDGSLFGMEEIYDDMDEFRSSGGEASEGWHVAGGRNSRVKGVRNSHFSVE